ncbi:MAG TPA: hypothetical protein VF659_09255 [Pyrinomonadaceae bacterium]|jgi:hypothetical protein
MSAAERALAANATTGGPPPVETPVSKRARQLTIPQEAVVNEWVKAYGLQPEQIYFDGESTLPYFDFEGLALVADKLADIPAINVEYDGFDPATGLVTTTCVLTLNGNRSRTIPACAQIGETMPGGEQIATVHQGLNVASSRALRRGLRMVGFDPVRAHEARKNGEDLPLTFRKEDDPRKQMLAEAHLLGEELGFIVGTEKIRWREVLGMWTHGAVTSAADLDERELGHFVVYLRSLRNARGRGAGAGQS